MSPEKYVLYRRGPRVSSETCATAAWAPMKKSGKTVFRIIRPETLVRWHRADVTGIGSPGRQVVGTKSMRICAVIRRMSVDKFHCGALRVSRGSQAAARASAGEGAVARPEMGCRLS